MQALFWVTILCFFSPSQGLASSLSLNEKLGFSREDRVVILHADDIGLVDSANEAAISLFEKGLVKSGSVLVPGPAAADAFLRVSRSVGGDLGVHLALTGENRWSPVAGAKNVPSLVSGAGFLFENPLRMLWSAESTDVEREFEAQIQKALEMPFIPTHLDTHMGLAFVKPEWFNIYLNLSRKYRLPPMVPRWSEDLKELLGAAGSVLQYYLPHLLKRVEEAGFIQVDYLHIFPFPERDEGYEARKKSYIDLLLRLKPGVTEILFHPADDSAAFREHLKFKPQDVVRLYEARIFRDPDVRELLVQQGIRLIGWKQIQAIYRWDQVNEM